MEATRIIIIVLLAIGGYMLYTYIKNNRNTSVPTSDSLIDIRNSDNKQKYVPTEKKSLKDYIIGSGGKKYPYKMDYMVNPDSMNEITTTNQYHPDYADVLPVLNGLIKESIFNPATLPVIVKTEGEKKDVFPIANRFVFDLSRKSRVSLSLVDIIYVTKQITEDQERVKFDLVIKKDAPIPSKIRMLLRVAIVYNTDNVVDENNFFDKAWQNKYGKKPILDEVFVLGYSSGYFDIESQAQTEYYALHDVDDTRFMDESTVNNIVKSVRRKHALENGCLNTAWDEDGRDYYVNDLDASKWGNAERRQHPTALPKPCSSYEADEMYGTIGTRIIDT